MNKTRGGGWKTQAVQRGRWGRGSSRREKAEEPAGVLALGSESWAKPAQGAAASRHSHGDCPTPPQAGLHQMLVSPPPAGHRRP